MVEHAQLCQTALFLVLVQLVFLEAHAKPILAYRIHALTVPRVFH